MNFQDHPAPRADCGGSGALPDVDDLQMSISEQDMARVAELARIRLDEATVREVTRRIGGILAMIDQMQAVDTERVAPMANPLDATQRLRDDEVSEPDQRESFLAIAPLTEDGLYLVPRVIE
jgi:aspartyl-tRNA(Asn)/glutamyl-tRNA(Gln) amidotransferase subunit C